MPGKSKDDTWAAKELTETIKDARSSSGKSKHRDKDTDKHRDKDRDREKHRDKERDPNRDKERDRKKDKDREREKDRHRDKEKERDGHREKDRDRDREKHRDKDRDRDKEKHRDRDKDRDRERHRDKDRDKERHRDKDKDRERRKDRERDSSKEKERRKHKDGESSKDKDSRRDRERSKDRDKHREKDRDRDREKEKRERSHREKSKDNDSLERRKEKDRHREKDKHRDKDKDKRRDKERKSHENGGGSGERERSRDGDRERRKDEEKKKHRDKERVRRDKDGTDSDREERKRRHRERDGSEDRRRRERRHEEERNGAREEVQMEEEPVKEQAANGEKDDYEDDFEDYDDDDFEEDDEDDDEPSENGHDDNGKVTSEIDEMRRAMAAENQAMRRSADSQNSRTRSERSSASSRPTTSRTGGRTFINFVAAKQRQISDQVSQRTKKRGQELMNLIDLDTAAYDIFDMPPVKEYDRYIASFGRSNTKQAFVQCNEDNLEREVQTEEIEGWDKWTQHPAEGALACGGTKKDELDQELAAEKEINSLHFTHFMEKVTQLFNVLLDEEMANSVGGKLETNKRSIVFSDGYTLMNTGTPILQGRCVTQVLFHPVQTNLILTLHSMPKKDSLDFQQPDVKVMEKAGLTNRGLMCVWNVNEPSRPQKILVLKSAPTTCTFSPSKATMAFCGTQDGSVCVWDLREPSSMHQKCEFGWGHVVVRVPTYSTEAGTPDESHHCAVVAMQPIVSAEDAKQSTMKTSTHDENGGMSFQLASVDERGTISFWVVLEIKKPDEAGSESDLGLVPSGKIKLIKSSSVMVHVPSRELGPVYHLKVTDMQLMPTNPNHFFITTDAGFISHGARNTERVSPKYYRVNEGVPVGIRLIDFSPFNLPCFLVGCADGSIHLFSTERGNPLASWPNATQGMEISTLRWSRSRPSVFFVMDITSKVYVWELLEDDSCPVKTEQFTRGRLTTLTVANDHSATGWGVAGRKPEMIIADDMGSLDVHQLNSKFCSADANELDAFNSLLEELI